MNTLDVAVSRRQRTIEPKHRSTPNASPARPAIESPLVSVIIPAYNAEAFIGRTLRSVVGQTYQNLEIIVVDDGSRDRTAEIVKQFAESDRRIHLITQLNGGVAAARNRGIEHACGEFIAPIDADDLWFSTAIAKLVDKHRTGYASASVVYTWSIDIDEQDQPTGGFHAATVRGNVFKTLICHNFLGNASATLIRKSCIQCVGDYNTQLKAQNAQGCEDWDLYLRLAETYKFDVVPEFLVGYRKLDTSMSKDYSTMARSQQLMLEAVRKKHPKIPGFLYRLARSSFCLYLARECEVAGNARASLGWLWQAVKVDPLTPVGRLGLYLLLVRNLAKKLIEKISRLSRKEATATFKLAKSAKARYRDQSQVPAASQSGINRFKVGIKVFIGSCLHFLLSHL